MSSFEWPKSETSGELRDHEKKDDATTRSFEKKDSTRVEAFDRSIAFQPEKQRENDIERLSVERVNELRMVERFAGEKVNVDPEKTALLKEKAEDAGARLDQCYKLGFGVCPSADPEDNFYDELWTRDLAHAGGNFFASHNPAALIDSLKTTFIHQRADGALPYRVERKRHVLQLIPGIKLLKKLGIDFITRKKERAVYEGQDFCKAVDTVPATIVALGELFINSEEGREFARENFDKLKKAIGYVEQKIDPSDHLLVAEGPNPDWADSLKRGGKLGTVNVWYARALRMMEFMSNSLGVSEDAKNYKNKFRQTKESIMYKLYDSEHGYFKTATDESRIDTTASVFGSLYLLNSVEAVRVQKTLDKYVRKKSGLQNFYPPYPRRQIFMPHRLIGLDGYHNEYVWPWVTAQNVQAKIKIALEHPDATVREQYKKESVLDMIDIADLFQKSGGAYEIYESDSRKPVRNKFYKPPKNIMGNLAAYHGTYSQLKKLGWI
ncbi:hypothetical protein HY967_00135 [Candidatus Jorgensenbacteria bacterium]|nr:hypothetical protein [Candidatus Jorgensenbacteria bacterium]